MTYLELKARRAKRGQAQRKKDLLFDLMKNESVIARQLLLEGGEPDPDEFTPLVMFRDEREELLEQYCEITYPAKKAG